MQVSGVKQRQKTQNKPQNGEKRRTDDEEEKETVIRASSSRFSPDMKLCVSLMCLSASLIMTWLQVQQNAKLAEMTEKYEHLYEKSRNVKELEEKMAEVSQKCALAVSLDAEVAHLQERFSSLTGQHQQLQQNLSALVQAVESVEQHTTQVSSDVTSRVSSIRTDVRRMAGLETEAEALLNQTQALEEKVAQTEKMMVKRIGELLAGSIDRVSALKSTAENSIQRLDQISALVHELSAANRKLSEQILALESGQAKLLKTAMFASDLKPKVFSIRQDLAIIQPKLDDLTLRIGLLAEDLMSRAELTRHTPDQKDQLTP
ncbi:inhibitor of nuclear factor kappa-B kinase-interacting protein isoform X2 [Garra rufa]|uniref:inhibitor of nuclear factor kappa-B kinase-interacting protein isoform X2 n=1 Tax=Garra rufa TaxID=137080 RepID=UPI003CCEC47B